MKSKYRGRDNPKNPHKSGGRNWPFRDKNNRQRQTLNVAFVAMMPSMPSNGGHKWH